ncbi:UPF0236 family protein [Geobacillus stearothermophilus]|uniref:UPF0236 family transposase-like protein n=1 Tax=Geobacillus stearothermophilus TaxID=1422 RepID=UPI002E203455|nr:UPF0236 family protein [Geobacillus stearothermophilus]MED4356807.1 UPF0236 family protein [Geobacillus stearothermophilus]
MKHLTTEWPLLKELEEQFVRTLQKVFAFLLAALLEEIDQQLAEARDKRRYQLKDKRPTTIQTLFGEVTFRRNDYYDRQTGNYTFLLDAELGCWKDQGLRAFLRVMAARIDGIGWRKGRWEEQEPQSAVSASTTSKRIEQAKRKAGRLWADVMRQNLPCLQRSSGTPIHQALSALRNGGWCKKMEHNIIASR